MARYYFHKTIYHTGLNKSKTIGANSNRELEYKCTLQFAQWQEQWNRKIQADARRAEADKKRAVRDAIAKNNEKSVEYAKKLTDEADLAQKNLESMLANSVNSAKFDFNSLKDFSKFEKPCPKRAEYIKHMKEPNRDDLEFNPVPGFWIKISKKKMDAFKNSNDQMFEAAHLEWMKQEEHINSQNRSIDETYQGNLDAWNKEKDDFEAKQNEKNLSIDELEKSVIEGNAESVTEFIELLIDGMDVPLDYESGYKMIYNPENKSVIAEINLPRIEDIPRLKSVTYIKTRQEFKETFYTDNQIQKIYDLVLYEIVLMYLSRIFSANLNADLVEAVVINGIVKTIDKSTGNDVEICVLSVREKRDVFETLNLLSIDPKSWFRSTRGVAAASLASVTPVQPIQILNKEDRRFVEGYSVIDSIDDNMNLAAIDWQDFENLIREVFGQEFSSNGGEVKVTQASRDGGVDAIAFDPDPIRGGKIVIQAKRYTNVVNVSAVRDLYGTLMNEGAMKGILVTTSYFGNDAYDFANGKPIQLIDGAQLLGLLEKHGHKARIDLQEAKIIIKDK